MTESRTEGTAAAIPGRMGEHATSRWTLAPSSFLALVLIVLGLLWSLANLIDCSEVEAVLLSTAVAAAVWTGILFVLWRARVPTRFSRWLTVLLATKTLLGVLFFYLVFAPASGLQDASDVAGGRIFGDTQVTDVATKLFLRMWRTHGLYFAVFGEYYRDFGNTGVPILYGLFYAAFGQYSTVSIPWNAVAMGVVALCMYATGEVLGLSARESWTAALIMLLMPSLFFGPPLYRDQFMLALIVLVVYCLVFAWKMRSFNAVIAAALTTVLLTGLRANYAMLPALLAVIIGVVDLIEKRKPTIWFLVAMVGVVLAWNWATGGEMVRGDMSTGTAGDVAQMALGEGPLGKIVFLLFTPLPWYRELPPNELVTQIFDYPQSLVMLSLFVCLFMNTKTIVSVGSTLFLVLAGIALWASPTWGPALFARYSQMALPLLLLAAVRVRRGSWVLYGGIAAGLIVIAHLGYELAKL